MSYVLFIIINTCFIRAVFLTKTYELLTTLQEWCKPSSRSKSSNRKKAGDLPRAPFFLFCFTLDLLISRPYEKEQLYADVLSIEFLKRRNYFTGNFYLSFINSNPNLIQTQIFALK